MLNVYKTAQITEIAQETNDKILNGNYRRSVMNNKLYDHQ